MNATQTTNANARDRVICVLTFVTLARAKRDPLAASCH